MDTTQPTHPPPVLVTSDAFLIEELGWRDMEAAEQVEVTRGHRPHSRSRLPLEKDWRLGRVVVIAGESSRPKAVVTLKQQSNGLRDRSDNVHGLAVYDLVGDAGAPKLLRRYFGPVFEATCVVGASGGGGRDHHADVFAVSSRQCT